MQRNEFLKRNWKRYPAMPKDLPSGRIISLGDSFVQIEGGEGTFKLSSQWKMQPTMSELRFSSQLLTVGDLIAIDEIHQQLWLLAPCLGSFALSSSMDLQVAWQKFLADVRSFFSSRGFLEVQTPSIVACPGTEPYLYPIKAGFAYLPTSPELHLKKLLSAGYRRIFEMRPCFRGQELGDHHQTEFWMLEWYRAFETHIAIEQDLIELLRKFEPQVRVEKVSVAELFQKNCNFEMRADTEKKEWVALASQLGLGDLSCDFVEDIIARIFVDQIEPRLNKEAAVLVHSYPACMSGYARINEQGFAERFELYYRGLEIANAFHELNDPAVQRERMEKDISLRKSLGRDPLSIDEAFLAALEHGMPPSGGIALGLERLFMALHRLDKIQDLKPFPY